MGNCARRMGLNIFLTVGGEGENDDVKLLWDINIKCDNVIEARRPDIILVQYIIINKFKHRFIT